MHENFICSWFSNLIFKTCYCHCYCHLLSVPLCTVYPFSSILLFLVLLLLMLIVVIVFFYLFPIFLTLVFLEQKQQQSKQMDREFALRWSAQMKTNLSKKLNKLLHHMCDSVLCTRPAERRSYDNKPKPYLTWFSHWNGVSPCVCIHCALCVFHSQSILHFLPTLLAISFSFHC